jgi:hypothetical protein
MIDDDTDISIHTHEELTRFKSLHHREYAHTHIYDVSLLERVGMDLKPPIIFRMVGWEKPLKVPHSGSHLLSLKFFLLLNPLLGVGSLLLAFAYSGESSRLSTPNVVSY